MWYLSWLLLIFVHVHIKYSYLYLQYENDFIPFWEWKIDLNKFYSISK